MRIGSQQQHLLLLRITVHGDLFVHDLSRQVEVGVAVEEEGDVPASDTLISHRFTTGMVKIKKGRNPGGYCTV